MKTSTVLLVGGGAVVAFLVYREMKKKGGKGSSAGADVEQSPTEPSGKSPLDFLKGIANDGKSIVADGKSIYETLFG